jgi:hypothetical protein
MGGRVNVTSNKLRLNKRSARQADEIQRPGLAIHYGDTGEIN